MLTDVNAVSGSFWTEEAIDCLRAISNRMISVEYRHKIIRIYKLRATNKTLQPLPIFLSRNPCNSFTEPSLRNTGIAVKSSETRLEILDESLLFDVFCSVIPAKTYICANIGPLFYLTSIKSLPAALQINRDSRSTRFAFIG
jgi:hypothetical protein